MYQRRNSRRSALALNQGSSPFGRSQVLPLNMPGGTFGSGHPAGGGAGAGATLLASLTSPAPSVQGSIRDVGPPPVDTSEQANSQMPSPHGAYMGPGGPVPVRPPTFHPQPISVAPPIGIYPNLTNALANLSTLRGSNSYSSFPRF